MGIYVDLMREDFQRLVPQLRRIHERSGSNRYSGEVRVQRGNGLLSKLCAAVARLPPDYHGTIKVDIVANDAMEQWTRYFGPHRLRSTLRARDGHLTERLGALRLNFKLALVDGSIRWRVASANWLGLALPSRWFAQLIACESIEQDHYHFDVSVGLPWVGTLINYAGWLNVD